MPPTADARLHAILVSYRRRLPGVSDVELLRQIDAKILQVLPRSMDSLPITAETVVGLAEMIQAIDQLLVANGLQQFENDPATAKAIAWLTNPNTPLEKIPEACSVNLPRLRQDLWSRSPTP